MNDHFDDMIGDDMTASLTSEAVNKHLKIMVAIHLLEEMTDDERMHVFNSFCKCCGDKNPNCYCQRND